MTKPIHTIKVNSFSEVESKFVDILEAFKKFGLVLIQGHKFSKKDQTKIAQLLGDVFEWNISSSSTKEEAEGMVNEMGGQSIEKNRDYIKEKDTYFLDWHIEQIYFTSPPLAGLWNMTKITCPPGHGNTRFADSNEIFNSLEKDEQEFLEKSIILWDKPANSEVGPFYTKAVEYHPATKIPIIRIETDKGCYILPTLYSLDGKAPTDKELDKFQELLKKIKSELYENENIRYEQEWKVEDFLIVDLFRMYHAVMGGFDYQERFMSIIVANANVPKNSSYNIKPEIQEY